MMYHVLEKVSLFAGKINRRALGEPTSPFSISRQDGLGNADSTLRMTVIHLEGLSRSGC